MKEFACKEMKMGGGCDEHFKGETGMEVAKVCGMHFMSSTDEAHKEGREMMSGGPTKQTQDEWWAWFNEVWEKRAEV